MDLDAWIDQAVRPLTDALAAVVFFKLPVAGTELPLVVLWLLASGIVFTAYFRFASFRLLGEALRLILPRRGAADAATERTSSEVSHPERTTGEVSHFQALATALSGTVGIGNIGGVAVAISIGGPGACLWMIVAGLLGMATKLVECTLGVLYREEHADGTVSGGPMYYLSRGFAETGWPKLGRALGAFYAAGIFIGCLGIGNMFQSNQAFAQSLNVSGGEASVLHGRGWLFGLLLAFAVGLVIVGGMRSIARVTARIVPFMAVLYLAIAFGVIALNAEALPFAFAKIFSGAFTGEGVAGGALGAMIVGFQRAVFSNEAGIGSASIAHSAVRTARPASEGIVSILEPLIDTVIICTTTALVLITTLYYDAELFAVAEAGGSGGVEITSQAIARRFAWAPLPLAVAAILFAFSTMIAWAYYGEKGWSYLVGQRPGALAFYRLLFCACIVIGASVQLDAVLDFSDAMVFMICVPNILGLYWLAGFARRELESYLESRSSG